MSAVMEAREPSAKYLNTLQPPLVQHFESMATAPGGVGRLRELILTLAVQGKLVPQDPKDEPASELMKQIRSEKDRLISEGKIKRDKPIPEVEVDEVPFLTPKTWEWVRLGDVTSYIQRGKSPAYTDHSAHRVISQKCVRWYGLDVEPARYITADSLSKYEEVRFLQAGDLLWNSTGTGTIGRACLVEAQHADARLVADSHVTVVRPIKLISSFLWRWIQSPYVQDGIEGAASGTTNQIELNTSTVVSHLMPLPPLAEQARIVTRVEELMRLCDALEAKGQLEAVQHAQLVQTLLGALTASTSPDELADNWQRVAAHFDHLLDRPEAIDALEQTILQLAVRGLLVPQDPKDEPASEWLKEMQEERERLVVAKKIRRPKPVNPVEESEYLFDLPRGWVWERLGNLGDWGAGATPSRANSSYYEGTIPWFKSGELTADFISESEERVTDKALRECSLRLNAVGDVLLAMYGATIGKTSILSVPATTNQAVCACTPFGGLSNTYLLLLMKALKPYFISIGAGGAQPNISREKVIATVVGLPPLPEQSRIVARVESLRRLCADLRQRLAARQTTQAHLAEALIDEVA